MPVYLKWKFLGYVTNIFEYTQTEKFISLKEIFEALKSILNTSRSLISSFSENVFKVDFQT